MNERIEELARESGYKHPAAVGTCEDYAYFDYKKFAELIIEECIRLIHQQDRTPSGFLYPKGANTHEIAIKTHFGVE